MPLFAKVSTGIPSLDEIIDFLRMGDNVVWQADSVEDYRRFVVPYVRRALADKRRVVYMRFAHHEALLAPHDGISVYRLEADAGFESFSSQVHGIITREGRDVFYVFDSLSDLLMAWATDLMIGNFFAITCPYLFELNTVAYFALLRGRHSFKTIARIRETTQVLLDIHNNDGRLYVHPLKVWQRYSPTMFLPHLQEGDALTPIINSIEATTLFSMLAARRETVAERKLDFWDRIFLQAKDMLSRPETADERRAMVDQLSRILLGREKRMLGLVMAYFSLEDLLNIKEHLIGTGFIGGKSVGMLLARNILARDPDFDWGRHLELHDSYYVGSDVFYSYIVQNGWWKLLMKQRTREGYFTAAEELRGKMLQGAFPDEVREQFQLMLEYFGQSPIIVRSSSLLEDAFGNAFAGKYESYFCVNQGSPGERYAYFEDCVRRIFASTMNEDALNYRRQRGLDEQDEQMALLVQRVSGTYRNHFFFPVLAGVGLSYNPFVWKPGLDARAGMLRLVLGMGTRAVMRVENDYPRIVALDSPLLKAHAGLEDTRRFSQHYVDTLDLEENRMKSVSLRDLTRKDMGFDWPLFAVRDRETESRLRDLGKSDEDIWVLTFDDLMTKTDFPALMGRMLKRIESVYRYPVDIEFTVNFDQQGRPQINLLQCRPFQSRDIQVRMDLPEEADDEDILLRMEGNFMGGSVSRKIDRIIYVDPQRYAGLSRSQRYDIARAVGRLNRQIRERDNPATMLL
ncbi:MAG TPA: PEP/pyruvate-binding domain-containing protein, partial [Syntrophales bacterium]|nr:PEP/pyruvate-binding domain-containing protein [Syntrophales bacterium]